MPDGGSNYMKNFPKFTGYMLPDLFLMLMVSTMFWLLIGVFFSDNAAGYPTKEEAKPVLYFTFIISVIYGILYWISVNAQDRDR
jgi:hypothetical protein